MIPPMSLVKNQVLENIIVNKLIYVMLQFATIVLIQGNQGQIDPIIPCHGGGASIYIYILRANILLQFKHIYIYIQGLGL